MTAKVYKTTVVFIFLCAVLFLLPSPAEAQTAIRLAAMLDKPEINYAEAAAFALEAAGKAAFADTGEAFRYAKERKWLPAKAQSGSIARYDGVSLLLMKAFELKGGMFYSMTKSPHHAYRELAYLDVIQGETDPAMIVSGEEFLFMINQLLYLKEETEPSSQRGAQAASAQAGIAFPPILFTANSAFLRESEKAKLRDIARVLETAAERDILIEGHSALAGTQEAQRRTGLLRARAVAAYLVSLGVRTEREISVRGYGAEHPAADNSTEEGMAQNRRAEITIGAAGGRQ